jgi:hypothetical protein
LLYTKGQKAYKNKIICNNVSVGYCNWVIYFLTFPQIYNNQYCTVIMRN